MVAAIRVAGSRGGVTWDGQLDFILILICHQMKEKMIIVFA